MLDHRENVDGYANLDEVSAVPPVQNRDHGSAWSFNTLEEAHGSHRKQQESVNDSIEEIKEVASRPVDKNTIPEEIYRQYDVEEAREEHQHIEHDRQSNRRGRGDSLQQIDSQPPTSNLNRAVSARRRISAYLAKALVPLYLILFSILGTLARLGMQTLTTYPEAPIAFSELWANVGGCLIMGYLSEDRMFFWKQWDAAMKSVRQIEKGSGSNRNGATDESVDHLPATMKARIAAKKSLPVYIGLSVGFCGFFTSFSTFVRDVFLALSNDLVAADSIDTGASQVAAIDSRNAGYSVMAVITVIVIEVSLCFSALGFGAHLAIILERASPRLPSFHLRKSINPVIIVDCMDYLGASDHIVHLATRSSDIGYRKLAYSMEADYLCSRLRSTRLSSTALRISTP
ncbi:hypothetical protein MMC18_002885 [Xylographa bjoerkii]|nr:hypothetical protein [Xylographa bjoerkii]